MKDAQKPDHVSLNTLIGHLREGRFVIPDFQRDFEWKPWDIRDLMRSIFLDYYIGSLLLWKGKDQNFEALSCEPIYGYDGSNKPEHIVLDGQQRLTALYYAFIAPDVPLPNRKNRAVFFVHVDRFMDEQYDQAFQYEWLSRRLDKVLNDRDVQYDEHIFPLSVVGQGGWELPNWVQGYERHWRNKATALGEEDAAAAETHANNAKEFGDLLRSITEQYQISYIELDRELGVDKVCDIFTQINSRGVRLDVFDLMNALLKPKGLQLKHMWREDEPKLEFVESDKMNVYVLQVMSLLRQAYCSPKYLYFLLPGQERPFRRADGSRGNEVLVPDVSDFEKRWRQAVDSLERAIKLLRHPQEFGAISSRFLPYVSILPVFASLQAHIKSCPSDQQLDAQRKVRHWYWASVFMNRYSGSVESTSARDFLDVKAWIADDAAEPALIEEFKQRFRNLEFRKEVKSGSSVYNGVFNLLVLAGARDWVSGNVPQHDDLDDHHIVPHSWGKQHLASNSIHTILNRTPLTADTNRFVIGNKLPNQYLPEWIAKSGEASVRNVLETHFISAEAMKILLRDPFKPDDFEAFIAERQRTLQDAIEDLLVKERLDLPMDLRELDAKVEKVELALRRNVDESLEGNLDLVPQHILVKVNERIELALKKNAALDADFFDTLQGKLEYFDLREIQDTITGKASWPYFESQFASKRTLETKFSQLAELRNGIRHSRTVNQVSRMEGEAALLWFEQVLGLAPRQ